MKKSILFLCTGNSCRSQMAEGFARYYWADLFDVYSAGLETHGINPYAMKVMGEKGIDISSHTSKTTADLDKKDFDYVITVCGGANENCPIFPAKTQVIHKGFQDPPALSKEAKNEQERLAPYRRVRDQVMDFVQNLDRELNLK